MKPDLPPVLPLDQVLTRQQEELVASRLEGLLAAGFGELVITVQNGHVRFLWVTTSETFPAGEGGGDFLPDGARRPGGWPHARGREITQGGGKNGK